MTIDKNVAKIIRARFSTLPHAWVEDCVQVSNELSAGPKSKIVQWGLKELEADLANAQPGAKHRLGTVLARQETAAGLNIDVHGNCVPTVNRPLSNDEGHALLATGRIWKDPGIDPGHGEHTHRIQWFILSRRKLVSDPRKFLLEIAKHRSPSNVTASALWDCLFDRLTDVAGGDGFAANGGDDFRCPEHLHSHLRSAKSNFPTLAGLLDRRHTKRMDARYLMGNTKDHDALRQGLLDLLTVPTAKEGLNLRLARRRNEVIAQMQGKPVSDAVRMFYQSLQYELKKGGITYNDDRRLTVKPGTNVPVAIDVALDNASRGFREKRFP